LAAELAAAGAADTRTRAERAQTRAQSAQRTDLVRRQLTGAESERARRRGLSPEAAAAEARVRHRLREEPRLRTPAPSSSLTPAAAMAAAHHATAELARDQQRKDQDLDHGV